MQQEHEDRSITARLDSLEAQANHIHGVPVAITKDAVKEALKEWLDDKFLLVGKYTVNGIIAAGLAALVYFILTNQGWNHE
jgi:hypothetical protein